MNELDPDTLHLPDHLLPIDQLLREASRDSTMSDPPEHLCSQTLDRCFASATAQSTKQP